MYTCPKAPSPKHARSICLVTPSVLCFVTADVGYSRFNDLDRSICSTPSRCLCRNIYMCVCVCVCTHTHTFIYIYAYIYIFIYLFIYLFIGLTRIPCVLQPQFH